MRIMGLDVGERIIGVAVSDEFGWTAQGLETLSRKDLKSDLKRIKDLVAHWEVGELVVGLPKNLNGSLGNQAGKILSFIEALKKELNLPITTWDERLTTVAAQRALLEAGLSRARRKKIVDKVAASLILQGYLDSRVRGRNG